MKPIEIVCHKGANEYAPENTYAAAQYCIDWGVDYVEIDVRTSKDGVCYLLHDATLERTTNGQGYLHLLTAAEIDQLDAGSWFHHRYQAERVPRLEPFLRWIKGKAKIFFDVKAADPQQLIDLVYATGFAQECFFWSGSDAWAQQLRALDPTLALKLNVANVADVQRVYAEFRGRYCRGGAGAYEPGAAGCLSRAGHQGHALPPTKGSGCLSFDHGVGR